MPTILIPLLLALSQVAIMAVGFAVIRVSEKRPRLAAMAIGAVFLAGCSSIFVGGQIADDGPLLAWRFVSIGLLVIIIALPSWLLVGQARRRNGVYHQRELGKLLFQYLGACWLTGILVMPIFAGVMLISAPPGTMR